MPTPTHELLVSSRHFSLHGAPVSGKIARVTRSFRRPGAFGHRSDFVLAKAAAIAGLHCPKSYLRVRTMQHLADISKQAVQYPSE
jgi:hypothetical protein